MTAIWGIAAVLAGLACIVLGDLVSEEVRGRLDALPRTLLRLAARRMPVHVRDDFLREWLGELHVFLQGAEATPVTRLVRGLRYAAGLLLVARRIALATGHDPRQRTRRSGLVTAAAKAGLTLAGVVVAVGAWWLVVLVFDIRPIFLPSPPDVAGALVTQSEYMLVQAWVTLYRTLAGFALALVLALLLALVVTAFRPVERTVCSLLDTTNVHTAVAVALAPLLVVWMGFGHGAKVTLVVVLCLVPIATAAVRGMSAARNDVGESSSSSLTPSGRTTLARMTHALPRLFVGLRAAVPFAMIGSVVGEISVPSTGLGGIIVQSRPDTAVAFGAMALLVAISGAFVGIIAMIERMLVPRIRGAVA